MSGASGDPEESAPPPSDGGYADAYTEGYAEGLRSALREVLSAAARGHSVAELRYLAQSRLARLPEEIALKRRTLLGAPRTERWGALLRPPGGPSAPPRPWSPGPVTVRIVGGRTYLVRERRPRLAIELVREAARRFDRLVLLSADPGRLEGLPEESVVRLELPRGGPDGPTIETLGGQVRTQLAAAPASLVYLDAIGTLVLDAGPEGTLRFVRWLGEEVGERGALVVSVHPDSLEPKAMGLLERSLQVVL
ncbi:MAG: hypothetical protein QXG65_05260 [Thermoplasmata archaeon]